MARSIELDRHEELGLLTGLLHGDRGIAHRFVQHYDALIELSVRRVYRRAGCRASSDEIRDAVGDIWLFLLEDDKRSLRRFEPERQIRLATWISLLARNKTIDRLRTSRERYICPEASAQLDEQISPMLTPSEETERREEHHLAQCALDQLKAADRRFLEAWYSEDREPDQLADDFGIAVGTVYSRRFKIQAKLQRAVRRLSRARRPRPAPRTLH